jgi:2-polyprenyl-3-methyl-5-hydroxy-6-metoxy-1,4-benzoquinol methylase
MNKTEKFWDAFAYKYDKITIKSEQTLSKTLIYTRKYLNANDIVLDFACGTGSIADGIADDVKKIHAIDISSKMIEVARRKTAERKIDNIEFAQLSIFDDTFGKETFNIVLAFNVLHLLEDPPKVILRMNELLVPGGLFISSTECGGENRRALINVFSSLASRMGLVPYIKFFTIPELEYKITNEGFTILETGNFHTFKQPNHFIVARKI